MGIRAYTRPNRKRKSVANVEEAVVVSDIGSKLQKTDSAFHAKRKQVQQQTVEDSSVVATAAATSSEALKVQQPKFLVQDSQWVSNSALWLSSSQPHSVTFAVPATAVAKDRGAFQQSRR